MKKLLSLVAFLVLFAGCATDNLGEGNLLPPPITQTDPNVIPLNDALDGMFALMNTIYGQGTRAAGRTIASIDNFNGARGKTRADGSPETLAYVVNFEEGGFAVLSATTNHEPIVCITEGGSLSVQELEEARLRRENPDPITTDQGSMWMSYEEIHNFGYEDVGGNPEPFVYEDYAIDWDEGEEPTEDLGEYMVSSTGPKEFITGQMAMYFDNYHDPDNDPMHDNDTGGIGCDDWCSHDKPAYYDRQTPPFEQTFEHGDWTDTEKIGPLLETKWHQSSPFNDLCPSGTPAGCVPIAVAQILAYNEKPSLSYYDIYSTWDELKLYDGYFSFSNDKNAVINTMLAVISQKIGKAVKAKYRKDGTSAYPAKAKKYMKKELGYGNAKKYNRYRQDKIKEMLKVNKPVFVSANSCTNGHAWVIDGSVNQKQEIIEYRDNEYCTTHTQTRSLIHCNYGWGGWCDGYYSPGVFNLKNGPVTKDGTDYVYDETEKKEAEDNDFDWCFRIITY